MQINDDDSGLNDLFGRYRSACPEAEPGETFMADIWQRIEERRNFRFAFQQLARPLMAVSAILVVLLLILNLVSNQHARLTSPSYVDALMAEHTAEKTDYTEAVRGVAAPGEGPEAHRQ